jgi:hypothetical protein
MMFGLTSIAWSSFGPECWATRYAARTLKCFMCQSMIDEKELERVGKDNVKVGQKVISVKD